MGSDQYRRRAVLGLVGVLTCGVLLMVSVSSLLDHQNAEMDQMRRAAVIHTVPVVVASGTLYPGFEILESDLHVIDMPPEVAPADASTSIAQVVGRVPAERILPDDPIREGRLASFGEGRGLAALIPTGFRALSLALTDASAGAGFLLPGDRVDVQVTALIEGTMESFVLLENVIVLAVDGSMTEESRKTGEREAIGGPAPAITVLLTPGDAVKATHAQREGKVALALRSRIDNASVATGSVDLSFLAGRVDLAPTPRRVEVREEMRLLHLIRGSHVETVAFPVEETQ